MKLERFGKDLESVKNDQIKGKKELKSELEIVQENLTSKKKVVQEMKTKEKGFENRLKN